MKVIGILGSPRANGASARLFGVLCDELRASTPDVEVDEVNLADLTIAACIGCDACLKTECPLDASDDYPGIVAKLEAADAIVVASPVYFFNVPGILKNFIDRSRRMKMDHYQLHNKLFGTLVASGLRNGGAETVSMLLVAWALSQGMIPLAGLGNPIIENGLAITTLQKDELKSFRKPTDEDEIGDKAARRLAERLVEMARLIKLLPES
jgi:multimeric flavodoxin WrbA